MKKNIIRITKFLSIFHPRNMYKIIIKNYSFTIDRTTELIRVIKENEFSSFLEVGVFRGDNLIPIAKGLPQLKCYGIDPYSGDPYADGYYKGYKVMDVAYYEALYQSVIKKTSKLNNIQIIRTTSELAAINFKDESLDMIFIDARHDYHSCKNDILTWLPKVKQGGILSGHDYSIKFFGVVEAVNELIGYDNVSIKSDSTWFYFKR